MFRLIVAEWISGDRSAIAEWSFGTTGSSTEKRDTERSFEQPRKANYPRQYSTGNSSTVSDSATASSGTATTTTSATTSTDVSSTPTSTYPAGGIAYHKVFRQTQLLLSSVADQGEWGYWYYATDNVANLTYQSGQDIVVRGQFQDEGFLADTQDTDYRAIDDDYPVFGFAVDLGSVGSTPIDTLFSLGLAQEIAILFDGAEGNETVPSLWTDYFSDDLAAVSLFDVLQDLH